MEQKEQDWGLVVVDSQWEADTLLRQVRLESTSLGLSLCWIKCHLNDQ